MLKVDELRQKEILELLQLVGKEREHLVSLQLALNQGTQKNTSEIRKKKKYIAQILTILKEREGKEDAEKKV